MSIMEILIRSISGYIFIIPGIILYFGALRKSAKRQILLHITTAFISYYNSIYILLLPNWYFDNDRYWQAESI